MQQANTTKWWAISSSIGTGKHAAIFIHRYSVEPERFDFREHGYDYLTKEGMVKLFKALEKKTRGKLHYSYHSVGGHSDTITSFSSGYTSGGETGYYANTDNASNILDGLELHS